MSFVPFEILTATELNAQIVNPPRKLHRLTATGGPYSTVTDTDMTVTADETTGRMYDIHFHSEVTTSATAGTYILALTRDTTQIGELCRLPASTNRVVDATITFVSAVTDSGIYRVRLVAFPAGGSVTLGASAAAPRTLKHRPDGIL